MRKLLATGALLIASHAAHAEFVAGIQLGNYAVPDSDAETSINTAAATVGYRFPIAGGFSLTPELRYGVGISTQTESIYEYDEFFYAEGEATFDIEKFYSITLRAQYNFANGLYLYTGPMYTTIEAKATGQGGIYYTPTDELIQSIDVTDSDKDDGIGVNAGIGYQFTDLLGLELAYEYYPTYEEDDDYEEFDTFIFTLGLRFQF